MKLNKWTLGLAAVGVVSLASTARADEKMSQVQTALSNTTISGYVDTSIQWNPGTGNYATAPVSFQGPSKADGFNLNVVDLALDKPLGEDPWAAGYHVELWMGPDANALSTLSNPFLNSTLPRYDYYSNPGGSDFAIRQAYVQLRTPIGNSAIDWKVGVFDSPLGYENTSSPLNPTYTHSYGYTIEPTELTGIEATFKVNDMISLTAGIADTVGPMINQRAFINYEGSDENQYTLKAESYKAYFGAVNLTAPDSWGWAKGSTLTAGVLNGYNPGAGSYTGYQEGGTQTSWYLGGTMSTPVTGLKAGFAFDYMNLGGNSDVYSYYNWTAALYATYQVNDKLSFTGRYDYWANAYGSSQAFDSVTLDAQYNLWANVISRLEVRWEHAEHGTYFGGTMPLYYSDDYVGYQETSYEGTDPSKENAFTVALQLVYQF